VGRWMWWPSKLFHVKDEDIEPPAEDVVPDLISS